MSSQEEPRAASVLVADDEPMLLRAAERSLRGAGYKVTACADGAAAAELLLAQPFDVVVSDIDMPKLGGIALLQFLREREIDVPVVLVTGDPTMDTAILAVEHGAFKYLKKPVRSEELLDVVARAVRRASISAERRRDSEGGALSGPSSMPPSIAVGVVLGGRYRLTRPLGEGGMSQVWEGTHLLTGRAVAVKLLHASLNSRAEMRKRLLREARSAGSVSHPNVVDIFDVFELPDGTPVLVMALLRGQTLGRRFAEKGAMTLDEVTALLLPVVSAVGTAHAAGVIHRDLKPENIFLADEGGTTVVKVLDFGIAKLISPEGQQGSAVTATGALVGTPGYMAPEQGFGERDVDHRADIWSIGAILYEALSGARPIEAENIGQMLKAFMAGGAMVPLAERRGDLPGDVTSLVD